MTNPPAGENLGRPPALDDAKRNTIIAMLANGSSRRVAARYVGCAPSTITRTADRDPAFADQLARAQQNVEVGALRCIRNATKKSRYWRAAAWLLERRNPDDFAPRKPNVLTDDQLRQFLASISAFVLQDLPEEKYERLMQHFDQLAPLPSPPDAQPQTPSTAWDSATDPTKAIDYFGEGPSPQLTEDEAHPENLLDLNDMAQ
jgi:hypothetical protein